MTKVVNVRTDPVKMGPSNLLHALSIWGEIASGVGSSSGVCIGSWRLQDTYAEVEDAMHLDPDGVTASLLLAYFLKTYLAGVECSALSLLNDPECLALGGPQPMARTESVHSDPLLSGQHGAGLEAPDRPPRAGNNTADGELVAICSSMLINVCN